MYTCLSWNICISSYRSAIRITDRNDNADKKTTLLICCCILTVFLWLPLVILSLGSVIKVRTG